MVIVCIDVYIGTSQLDLNWMTGEGKNHQGCVELGWLKSNAYDQSSLQHMKESSKPLTRAVSVTVFV